MGGEQMAIHKYFPNNEKELNFILDIYSKEIRLRAEWVLDTAKEIDLLIENRGSPSNVIRKCMDLIGNAIVILRIIDFTGARKNELERAKERTNLIFERWLEMKNLQTPKNLRKVRNDYEHFDTRLDEWATVSKKRLFADMLIGPDNMIGGLGEKESVRRFFEGHLYFWNRQVNLYEVVRWSKDISIIVSKKHP